jgi:glycosyltransferase involved in cell wall biosynthesis
MDRLRVLILADVCNPDWPSLPIVGYKYAKAIADYADVTVVTQIRNRPNIERDGLGNAQVVYLDTESIARPIYRLAELLRGGSSKGWTIQMAMDYPTYLAFEWKAWQQFRRRLKAKEFDIVHRITPMSPTLPSYIAKRCPVPFLLGPLNGNLPWPKAFTAELKREKEWLSYFRSLYKLLPYYRSSYYKSSGILAAFPHTIQDIPKSLHDKTINFPEVGIDPEIFSLPQRQRRDRMTILYAGRLVPYKLPEIAVRCFAASPILRQHRLVVLGDGPELPRLEQIIQEHQLQDCVELLGKKPQKVVGELMREAEIFAFPSIRELGAGVVVEAMACGMACVVVDYGGPATLIQPDWGVKVPMGTFEQLLAQYITELEALVVDPDRTLALGTAAHHHAMTYYPWNVKAKKTIEVYQWLLNPHTAKPTFW